MSNNIILNRDFVNLSTGENFIDHARNELFLEFASLGMSEKVKEMIDQKIDINVRDEKGRNALFWAMHNREFSLIKKLITSGINTNVTLSLSAINYAVYKNDVKMIKCLKNSGIDLNEYDDINSTPLIYAVLYNKLQSIDYLIKNGALLEHEDFLGNSALSLAYDLKIEFLINKFSKLIKSA